MSCRTRRTDSLRVPSCGFSSGSFMRFCPRYVTLFTSQSAGPSPCPGTFHDAYDLVHAFLTYSLFAAAVDVRPGPHRALCSFPIGLHGRSDREDPPFPLLRIYDVPFTPSSHRPLIYHAPHACLKRLLSTSS